MNLKLTLLHARQRCLLVRLHLTSISGKGADVHSLDDQQRADCAALFELGLVQILTESTDARWYQTTKLGRDFVARYRLDGTSH